MEETIQTKINRRYITAAELGEMMGLSADAVWRLARLNKIPHSHVGRRVVFNPETVFAFIDQEA